MNVFKLFDTIFQRASSKRKKITWTVPQVGAKLPILIHEVRTSFCTAYLNYDGYKYFHIS